MAGLGLWQWKASLRAIFGEGWMTDFHSVCGRRDGGWMDTRLVGGDGWVDKGAAGRWVDAQVGLCPVPHLCRRGLSGDGSRQRSPGRGRAGTGRSGQDVARRWLSQRAGRAEPGAGRESQAAWPAATPTPRPALTTTPAPLPSPLSTGKEPRRPGCSKHYPPPPSHG